MSAALRVKDQVVLSQLPRMADFAHLAVAAEMGLGEPARFLQAYTGNRIEAETTLLETEPVAQVLLRWLPEIEEWTNLVEELLDVLNSKVAESERRAKGWPSSARGLTSAMQRLAPVLRRIGVVYERGGRFAGTRRSVYRLVWTGGGGYGGSQED